MCPVQCSAVTRHTTHKLHVHHVQNKGKHCISVYLWQTCCHLYNLAYTFLSYPLAQLHLGRSPLLNFVTALPSVIEQHKMRLNTAALKLYFSHTKLLKKRVDINVPTVQIFVTNAGNVAVYADKHATVLSSSLQHSANKVTCGISPSR